MNFSTDDPEQNERHSEGPFGVPCRARLPVPLSLCEKWFWSPTSWASSCETPASPKLLGDILMMLTGSPYSLMRSDYRILMRAKKKKSWKLRWFLYNQKREKERTFALFLSTPCIFLESSFDSFLKGNWIWPSSNSYNTVLQMYLTGIQ